MRFQLNLNIFEKINFFNLICYRKCLFSFIVLFFNSFLKLTKHLVFLVLYYVKIDLDNHFDRHV